MYIIRGWQDLDDHHDGLRGGAPISKKEKKEEKKKKKLWREK